MPSLPRRRAVSSAARPQSRSAHSCTGTYSFDGRCRQRAVEKRNVTPPPAAAPPHVSPVSALTQSENGRISVV